MTTILDLQTLRQRLAPYIRHDGPSSGSFPAVFSQVELLALLDRAEAAPNLLIAPDWMIIDAVRYVLGRRTYQVSDTCEWLLANWTALEDLTRACIKKDIEEAASRGELGDACDVAEWEKVRALWMVDITKKANQS